MLRPPKGYEWDYLGPDPNDPSGEKWGWINEEGERWFEPGDKLPTGEEFVCYTEDGSPIWKEPVVKFTPHYAMSPMKVIKIKHPLARFGWRWATGKGAVRRYIGRYFYERFKA